MSSGAQFGISGADSLKIAALPIKHYGNDEKISEFLDTAKTEGMTAIAVTIKDDAGKVYFDYEKARGYNATAKKLLDLTRTAALITEKGMTPVAVMDTFKDPIAAASRDNCYMYIDGSSMWLDNTLAAGGKPWLSVYSRSAEKYLLGIEQAAIDAGFKRIILNSVQYPDVRDLTTIKFPEDADDASKLKALGDFVNKAYKKGEEQNVAVSAVFSGEAVLGQKDNIYFGSPFETEALSVSPVIDSSLLSGSVTVGGQRIKNPGDNLDKLLKAIVDAAGGAAVTPVIYAGDEKADELTQAIEQTEGMDGYILYSDDVPEDLSAAYGTEG